MYHHGRPVYLSKVPAVWTSIKVFFLKFSYISLQASDWVYFSGSSNFPEKFYLSFFTSLGKVVNIFDYFIRIWTMKRNLEFLLLRLLDIKRYSHILFRKSNFIDYIKIFKKWFGSKLLKVTSILVKKCGR
jgi:hypothetical protein